MEKELQRFWIGFDLGGTKMLITLYDENLSKLNQIKLKTVSNEGEDASIQKVIGSITESLNLWGVPVASLAGIGIGVPGVVNMTDGIVLNAPNLQWKSVPLKKLLESSFGVPAVVVNDVDAGTYGEYTLGAAQNGHCVLGVFPGTGIGGACIYNGEILHGSYTTAMEIGHVQVVEDGMLCGCGKYGCLETVASRLAIAGQAAIAAYRGQAPALFAKTGCDLKKIKSAALAAAIAEGDMVIETIISRAAGFLGKGIAAAITLLAPDVVVLGGGLVEAMPQLFKKQVADAIIPALFRVYQNTYRVEIAQLGDDAVSAGAAAYAKSTTDQS